MTPVWGDEEAVDRPGAGDRRLERAARHWVHAVYGPLIDHLSHAVRRDPEAPTVGSECHRRMAPDGDLGRRADRSAGVGPEAMDFVRPDGHSDHLTVGRESDAVELGA